jgi:hypothetical protein
MEPENSVPANGAYLEPVKSSALLQILSLQDPLHMIPHICLRLTSALSLPSIFLTKTSHVCEISGFRRGVVEVFTLPGLFLCSVCWQSFTDVSGQVIGLVFRAMQFFWTAWLRSTKVTPPLCMYPLFSIRKLYNPPTVPNNTRRRVQIALFYIMQLSASFNYFLSRKTLFNNSNRRACGLVTAS